MKNNLKKIFSILIMSVIFSSNNTAFSQNIPMEISDNYLNINSKNTFIRGYELNGSNYYKLRDISNAFSGTNKKFDVNYTNNQIQIILNHNYSTTPWYYYYDKKVSANISKVNLIIDNSNYILNTLNINGYNYVRLRDIGSLLDFSINYDKEKKLISLNTENNYLYNGENRLQMPTRNLAKNFIGFKDIFINEYSNFDSIKKLIDNELRNNKLSYSELVNFKNKIDMYNNYFNNLKNSKFLKRKKYRKLLFKYKEFLQLLKNQRNDIDMMVLSFNEVNETKYEMYLNKYKDDSQKMDIKIQNLFNEFKKLT